jgi:hypothetical protein
MGEAPGRNVQEVIDWWKEYGFRRDACEYADVDPLLRELLKRMSCLSCEGQMQVFEWLDGNG